jgi:predicted GIY-YIG superfamily endonuclease
MKTTKSPPRFWVYAIELDSKVQRDRSFAEANPGLNPALPCLYVGATGRTPLIRFQQHRAGKRSSRFPRRYGRTLRQDLIRLVGAESYDNRADAERAEAELALRLQRLGFGVWWN